MARNAARLAQLARPLALAALPAGIGLARCEPENPSLPEKLAGDAAPFAGAATFGGVSGYCSGYAVAKLGKGAAFLVGVSFMTFQVAAYNGYIHVDWKRVEGDFMKRLDLNNDGKVDSNDVKIATQRIVEVLTTNMGAAAGGFATGFVLGIRKGWH